MHNVMHNDIVTLMVVEVDHSRYLAEAPAMQGVETGMRAQIGDIQGTISWVAVTHRDSKAYQLGKALADHRPLRVTGVFMPWDIPGKTKNAPTSGNIGA
ncbi:MAG: hypothetical protein IJ960_00770 [Oscillospiraceae bacterium]|nr:hypothetical protein [Oscillospiraceae bacterium]